MKIIFQIDGGIGKCIAATAVCKAIKTQHPADELIVVSGYPEVFLCNPYVNENLSFNDRIFFYERHIKGQEVKMCVHNPYLETAFINRNGHLLQVWCEMFGIRYNGEQPELFINSCEQFFYATKFQSDKPIFVIQTNGGGKDQPNKYSWARDLPLGTAQQIVNAFAPHYLVVHIRRDDQPQLQNTVGVQANFREICALLLLSQKRLLIDSFAQHASAALGLPSVVCWIANTPQQFGYNLHTNIIANPFTVKPELRHAVYSEFNISGDPVEFPYVHEGEIFNVQDIYNALLGIPATPALQVQQAEVQQPVETILAPAPTEQPASEIAEEDAGKQRQKKVRLHEVPVAAGE